MQKPLVVALGLVGLNWLASAQTVDVPLTLADGERAWTAVTEGAGRVSWAGSGPAAEVNLAPGGGYAGIAARLDPPPPGLLDVGLLASAQSTPQLAVQFTRDQTKPPDATLWSTAVSGAKRQRLAARLAPPAVSGQPLYLSIGARGAGTLRLSDLVLVLEPLPPPVDTSSKAPLPDGWQPEGTLDAQAREIAGTTELLVEVNGLQVSINPDTACALGGFAPLSALILVRGNAERKLAITGEFPEGVVCDPRDYPITKGGTLQANLRLQGVLPGAHTGRLIVSSGKESAALPIHVAVSRSYPAFGATATGAPGSARWQLQEIRVQAGAQSTAPDLLAQVTPLIDEQAAIPVLFFDGLPTSDVLREFVDALKGKVGLYSAAWRANRPYAGDAPQAEAEALFAAARDLYSVVTTADLDAACMSPVFDCSANVEGSSENRLLDACLGLKMSRYCGAIVVTARPLPVGGVLGESAGDRNVREPSVFWADLDVPQYPYAIEALMEKHAASLPILTSGIGGPAGTDERLDAVKVARAMAIAAYAGATGATFPEVSEGGIALTRPDGSRSPAGLAVKELSRELAGAAPILRSWTGEEISGRFADSVVALPFVRDDEVILVLWNNTSMARPLTLTLRQPPFSEHVLTISRDDPFIDRTYQGRFEFSDRAVKAKRQEVYVALAPLQVKVLRYRLQLAIPTWLDSIAFTPRPKGGPPSHDHDDRPWWKRLQDWAEGLE